MSVSEAVQLLRVEKAHIGQRLDNFLIRQLKGLPRARIYRLIRRGEVRVNKKRCKPEHKLDMGDEIRVPPYTGRDSPQIGKASPALRDFLLESILLETEQFLVINKPAGLAVHGGSSIRLGLIEALRQCKPQWSSLELAHRLDRATSGCLVISKNSLFLKHMQNLLKIRNVKKNYLALVHGKWPESLLHVDASLQKEAVDANQGIVRVCEAGKPSLTRFALKQHYAGASLIEAMPETGRTHQIRVHCQHAGHSIVGDQKYTSRAANEHLQEVKSLCLHAWKIEFTQPQATTPVKVQAPLAGHLESLLRLLDKN